MRVRWLCSSVVIGAAIAASGVHASTETQRSTKQEAKRLAAIAKLTPEQLKQAEAGHAATPAPPVKAAPAAAAAAAPVAVEPAATEENVLNLSADNFEASIASGYWLVKL